MSAMNKPVKQVLADPRVNIPAAMLLHAGLSGYGNALNQNEYEKADGRLILESVLSGLGAGAGAIGLRRLGQIAPDVVKATVPARNRVMIRRALAQNPELDKLRQAMPAVAAVLASGAGAGFAGNALAPFIAGNLNMVGVPSMSGRQQDYYEEDQPSLSAADLALLAEVARNS